MDAYGLDTRICDNKAFVYVRACPSSWTRLSPGSRVVGRTNEASLTALLALDVVRGQGAKVLTFLYAVDTDGTSSAVFNRGSTDQRTMIPNAAVVEYFAVLCG